MINVKQGTEREIHVVMVDSTDKDTGLEGLTLVVSILKTGGTLTLISPTVVDQGKGIYSIFLSATDNDTLGNVTIHIEAEGASPRDRTYEVVAYDPQSSTTLGLSSLTTEELTEDPGAAPLLAKAVMLLYMALRNKETSTASLRSFFNDAGVEVFSQVLSDDGSTFTKQKI